MLDIKFNIRLRYIRSQESTICIYEVDDTSYILLTSLNSDYGSYKVIYSNRKGFHNLNIWPV
jgi:hypothetical protein